MTDASAQIPIKIQTNDRDSCCGGDSACCRSDLSSADARVRLSEAPEGFVGVVCHHDLGTADAELLRAMGLRPMARVRICKPGEPCIVQVLAGCGHDGVVMGASGCSCRIGLSGSLARRVSIEAIVGAATA
ncbi:MAG: ferrous iron transport protein A [Phycisphaeraceae bacterium]|nr:ferrous iron transport protein A [Phycisphaeraceae bacterium]